MIKLKSTCCYVIWSESDENRIRQHHRKRHLKPCISKEHPGARKCTFFFNHVNESLLCGEIVVSMTKHFLRHKKLGSGLVEEPPSLATRGVGVTQGVPVTQTPSPLTASAPSRFGAASLIHSTFSLFHTLTLFSGRVLLPFVI